MFAQWAVEALKRLTVWLSPLCRWSYPGKSISNLFFAIAVFFWFNRRPLSAYSSAFWVQLLYLVQLFKVSYTLRFVMVELVYRELRTFFCFIHPFVIKIAILKKWQTTSPCILKFINMIFILLFIGLNLLTVFVLEWMGRYVFRELTKAQQPVLKMFCRNRDMIMAHSKIRRRRHQSSRYRRRKSQSPKCPLTRPLFRFWPRGAGVTNVYPVDTRSGAGDMAVGGIQALHKKTRSGRDY